MHAGDQEALSSELLSLISRVVNPRHGLITGFFEQSRSASAPSIRVAHAVVTPPTYFRANSPSVHTIDAGTGAGFDRETACWAALGEAVERYAGSLYWLDQVTEASANALGDAALDLTPMIRVSNSRIVPYDPAAPRGWLTGRALDNGRPLLMPAALSVLGYKTSGPHEVIAQCDSTGLACGRSFEDAALRGLCEVIERDAFASNWLLGRAPPRITFSERSLGRLRAPVAAALSDPRLQLSVHHLAFAFGVHVVLGVADHEERGYGVVSAAASTSPIRAVEKAAAEALHGWTAACVLAGRPRMDTANDVRSPSDHVRFYLEPERFSRVRRLAQSPDSVSFNEMLDASREPADLVAIAAALRQDGFVAAGVDLTTPDVAELGLAVAKTMVPGLQPLVFGSTCVEVPDRRRLDQWRRVWGLPEAVFNPDPHPFP